MYDEWYRSLFELANELYGSNVYAYYFDLSFEETVRRHNTRNREFGEKDMRRWWREKRFFFSSQGTGYYLRNGYRQYC